MKINRIILPFALLYSSVSLAAPVDLSGWVAEGGNSSWNLQTLNAPNDTVLQTVNGQPTVFFESGSNALGTALSGSIKVTSGGNWDDDFIGFVLGYDTGEIFSASADFWLIDWKQNDQNYGPFGSNSQAFDGLALSHVTNSSPETSFWAHSGGVNEVARAENLGSTGWQDNTEYTFDLVYTTNLIQVYVDNVLELNVTAAQAGVSGFSDGAFGFYNFSQQDVLYAGITKDPANVPEPSVISLLLMGLAGFGFTANRRRKQ